MMQSKTVVYFVLDLGPKYDHILEIDVLHASFISAVCDGILRWTIG